MISPKNDGESTTCGPAPRTEMTIEYRSRACVGPWEGLSTLVAERGQFESQARTCI
jgi:hypothetical protein